MSLTSSSKEATESEGMQLRNALFLGTDSSRRTVRTPRLAANQEIFQKIYGSAVEIVAIDDLLKGDFTAALQGEGKLLAHIRLATYTFSRR